MGRQSARLVYNGEDHSDIYYDGHNHYQMYLGNQLVWERGKPKFVFGTVGLNSNTLDDDYEPFYKSGWVYTSDKLRKVSSFNNTRLTFLKIQCTKELVENYYFALAADLDNDITFVLYSRNGYEWRVGLRSDEYGEYFLSLKSYMAGGYSYFLLLSDKHISKISLAGNNQVMITNMFDVEGELGKGTLKRNLYLYTCHMDIAVGGGYAYVPFAEREFSAGLWVARSAIGRIGVFSVSDSGGHLNYIGLYERAFGSSSLDNRSVLLASGYHDGYFYALMRRVSAYLYGDYYLLTRTKNGRDFELVATRSNSQKDDAPQQMFFIDNNIFIIEINLHGGIKCIAKANLNTLNGGITYSNYTTILPAALGKLAYITDENGEKFFLFLGGDDDGTWFRKSKDLKISFDEGVGLYVIEDSERLGMSEIVKSEAGISTLACTDRKITVQL